MPNNYTTGEMAEKGRKGEEIVIGWLENSKQVKEVIGVTNEKLMQRVDVDVAVRLEDGRTILAEIKSDKNLKDADQGNMLFELQRVYTTATPNHCSTLGWSVRTPAEYIIWYSEKIKKIIVVKTVEYRAAFQEYMKEAGRTPRYSTITTKIDWCSTINVIFGKEYLRNRFSIYELTEQAKFETVEETAVPF